MYKIHEFSAVVNSCMNLLHSSVSYFIVPATLFALLSYCITSLCFHSVFLMWGKPTFKHVDAIVKNLNDE